VVPFQRFSTVYLHIQSSEKLHVSLILLISIHCKASLPNSSHIIGNEELGCLPEQQSRTGNEALESPGLKVLQRLRVSATRLHNLNLYYRGRARWISGCDGSYWICHSLTARNSPLLVTFPSHRHELPIVPSKPKRPKPTLPSSTPYRI